MTVLPRLLLRAPYFFYAAAVLFFLASYGLSYWELRAMTLYAEPGNPMSKLAMMKALYQAALDAIYIAANGVIAHILIAIWRDGALRREREGEP